MELNKESIHNLIKEEFDKFYNASPFVGGSEANKIAMNGAFYAGFNLAAEKLIDLFGAALPKK